MYIYIYRTISIMYGHAYIHHFITNDHRLPPRPAPHAAPWCARGTNRRRGSGQMAPRYRRRYLSTCPLRAVLCRIPADGDVCLVAAWWVNDILTYTYIYILSYIEHEKHLLSPDPTFRFAAGSREVGSAVSVGSSASTSLKSPNPRAVFEGSASTKLMLHILAKLTPWWLSFLVLVKRM